MFPVENPSLLEIAGQVALQTHVSATELPISISVGLASSVLQVPSVIESPKNTTRFSPGAGAASAEAGAGAAGAEAKAGTRGIPEARKKRKRAQATLRAALGPLRLAPGFDPLMQCYGAVVSLTGRPEDPPTFCAPVALCCSLKNQRQRSIRGSLRAF